MPLSLTSKTYPVAQSAVVGSLVPDGDNGWIGLTLLDAITVLSDPANHVFADPTSTNVPTLHGQSVVAFLFSDDGGKTYQALPILIRTPSSAPQYPYGLPIRNAGSYPNFNPQFATWFRCVSSLAGFTLLRDPQSGCPVLFGGSIDDAGVESAGRQYKWTAQGTGRQATDWVTTRVMLNPTLPALPNINSCIMTRFFNPNYAVTGYVTSTNPYVYPPVPFGGSPALAFGGAPSVFPYGPPSLNAAQSPFPFIRCVNTGPVQQIPVYNSPFESFGQDAASNINSGVYSGALTVVAQHPRQPSHLAQGNPGGVCAQSYDFGQTATKLYSRSYAQYQQSLEPPLNVWPFAGRLLFVEDALYCFGNWGFCVSRDGGQTWPGETINGIHYNFNLLHAAGGGYYPDSALFGIVFGAVTPSSWAFPVINISTVEYYEGGNPYPSNYIVRNSAPDPANPGGRVNGLQTLFDADGIGNVQVGPALPFEQQPVSETVYHGGTLWHAVCLAARFQSGPNLNQFNINDTRWIMLASHDQGATWTQLPEPPRVPYGTPLVADQRTGWLWWGLGWYSRDAGQTWIAVPPSPPTGGIQTS